MESTVDETTAEETGSGVSGTGVGPRVMDEGQLVIMPGFCGTKAAQIPTR